MEGRRANIALKQHDEAMASLTMKWQSDIHPLDWWKKTFTKSLPCAQDIFLLHKGCQTPSQSDMTHLCSAALGGWLSCSWCVWPLSANPTLMWQIGMATQHSLKIKGVNSPWNEFCQWEIKDGREFSRHILALFSFPSPLLRCGTPVEPVWRPPWRRVDKTSIGLHLVKQWSSLTPCFIFLCPHSHWSEFSSPK